MVGVFVAFIMVVYGRTINMSLPYTSSVIRPAPVIAICGYQGNCRTEVFTVSAKLDSRITL